MADYDSQAAAKQELFAQVARESGVAEEDVRKVLVVLGIDNHFDEASRLLGATPTLEDTLLGFHVSENSVMV